MLISLKKHFNIFCHNNELYQKLLGKTFEMIELLYKFYVEA